MKKILDTLIVKWPEYLLEVIVIIIGILAALGLNNWNQQKQQAIEEKKILSSLKVEFQYNLERLDQTIELAEKKVVEQKMFLKYSGPKYDEISPNDFNQLAEIILAGSIFYQPGNGAITDLITSGKLNRISDDNLRSRLSIWDATLEEYTRGELISEGYREKIKEIFIQKGNLSSYYILMGIPMDYGDYVFNTDNRKLLTNQELTNLVLMRIAHTSSQLNEYNALSQHIKAILDLLERNM